MKRINFILTAAALLTAASACNPDAGMEQESPEIKLAETSVTIPSEGGEARIAYQVENAVEGVSATAVTDDEWISDLVVKARVIEFSVEKNETDGPRTGTVRISYKDAEDVEISVNQEQWEAPISVTVHNTDATSVTFSVKTTSADMTWIGQIVGKEWFDSYDGDQEVFEADLSYFASEASYYGVTLKEYISGIMIKGSKDNLRYSGLDPLSEYVLYVYGITAEGDRTTDLYTAPITTAEPYDGPVTFDFKIEETDAIMDVTVTPSHDGVDYYWNMTTPEALAEYGDNIEDGIANWLKSYIDELLEYEDYASKEEFFEYNTTKNENSSTYEGIVNTDYIFFAFKWNSKCEIIGDIAYVEHKTGDVKPSDNQITVTVSNITQSSFHVETKTTNSDPYFLLAEPAFEMADVDLEDDDAVFQYFYDKLGSFQIWSYISNGNMGGNFIELEPDTEYNLVTFGYKSGARTTAVQLQKVKTLALESVEDFKFTFEIENIKTTSAEASIIPSDKGRYYYWDIFPSEMTEEEAIESIKNTFNEDYYGDFWEFSSQYSVSDDHGYLNYLTPETEYKIGAVLVDNKASTLKFLSGMYFSEPFTTPEAKISPTVVFCGYSELYDGDEIAELEPNKFGGMAGYPWFYLNINIDGEYSSYFYTVYDYIDGLEDSSEYPDSMLYDQLLEKGWSSSKKQLFRGVWDKPLMIAAMAIDPDGNYTRIFRKKIVLSKEDADPAEDFVNNYGKTSAASASVSQKPQRVSSQAPKAVKK